MNGFVDIFEPMQNTNIRVQVEVKAVHPDGSFDFEGDYFGGRNALIPFYNEYGIQITPTVD